MNEPIDNSWNASINRGTQAAEQNKPAPVQRPGQTWDSHTTELNQYNHTLRNK